MKLLTRDVCCDKGTQKVPVCVDCQEENELYALELAMTLEQQRERPKKYPTAGQPKKVNKKVPLTIRIKPELLARITGNRSAFIESAIIEQLNR